MKVLIVGLNFWPEIVGVGQYSTDLANYLAGQGHSVRVVAGAPYYPEWKRPVSWPRVGYRSSCLASESGLPIQVRHCPHFIPRKVTALSRLLHLASFGLSSVPALVAEFRHKPDVVIAIAPTLVSSLGALLLARTRRVPALLHVQDLEVDAAFEMGFLKSRVLFTPIKWLEAATLKLFDRVSTISPPMMERIMRKGVRPERVILFPNGVNTKAIFPLSKPSVLREELGIAADRIVALYSGTMGAKQGLEDLIEVTREPGLETIQFVLCGEGPARHRLEKMAGGQANIQFLALQSGDRLNELLNLADIHLLPQRADVADFVKPSKLGGMLASGRPVVAWAAPNTQVAQAVNGCGTAVRPGDIKAFAEALRTMAAAPLERRELGEAARRRAVNELERVSILSTFENDLAELTNV